MFELDLADLLIKFSLYEFQAALEIFSQWVVQKPTSLDENDEEQLIFLLMHFAQHSTVFQSISTPWLRLINAAFYKDQSGSDALEWIQPAEKMLLYCLRFSQIGYRLLIFSQVQVYFITAFQLQNALFCQALMQDAVMTRLICQEIHPQCFPQLLQYAILHASDEAFRVFIELGADVNQLQQCSDSLSELYDSLLTPLQLAIIHHQTQRIIAFINHPDIQIDFQLVAGDRAPYPSALMLAAFVNNIEAVQQLLQKGAMLNCHDYQGQTALHYAIRAKNAEVIQLLLNADDVCANKEEIKSSLQKK